MNVKKSQEACGVWLDTADLRGKRRRALPRPISKFLNPSFSSAGYSVAVTLNFTQTKLQLPPTKQTSISSFFAPQLKTEKTATSLKQLSGELLPPSPTRTLGRKRKRDVDETKGSCDMVASQSPQNKLVQEGVGLNEERSSWECLPLARGTTEKLCFLDEEEGLAEKKRHTVQCLVPPEPDAEQSQKNSEVAYGHCDWAATPEATEPLMWDFFTQDSQGNRVQAHHKPSLGRTEGGSLQRGMPFGVAWSSTGDSTIHSRHRCSPCKPVYQARRPSQEEKENQYCAGAREQYASPLKHQRSPSLSSPLRTCVSPRRRVLGSHMDEEKTYAMLFTQDSQGQRVIAHRNPLSDHTNQAWSLSCCGVSKETDDSDVEAEMLFTQDSQGNTVIKH